MTYSDVSERIEWLPSPLRDGVRIGRSGEHMVVEWRGIGRFFALPTGAQGEFVAAPTASRAQLEKFRATSLIACRRYLAGKLSLHGSSVLLPSGAVVLVGDCGAGKSTTGMALVEGQGAAFLADDIVPIDWEGSAPIVSPVEDSFWLSRDASAWFGLETPATEKRAFPPRVRSRGPERLRAIVHLVFDDSIAGADLRPVMGQEAFMLLSGAHVCYSVGGDADALRNLDARTELARATSVFQLRRRRTLETLSVATQLLSESLSARGDVEQHP